MHSLPNAHISLIFRVCDFEQSAPPEAMHGPPNAKNSLTFGPVTENSRSHLKYGCVHMNMMYYVNKLDVILSVPSPQITKY